MAEAQFLQAGDSIDYTPVIDTAAGTVVAFSGVSGSLLGVTKRKLVAGELGALCVTGVFKFTKEPGVAIAFGQQCFWDTTNRWLSTAPGQNIPAGRATKIAATSDVTAECLLQTPAQGALGIDGINAPLKAASAFAPSDLSGLQLWLESSPRVGFLFTDTPGTAQAANGNAVAHWKDHSSNGRNLTEASAKPVVTDSLVPTQPNGRATLDFTAASLHRLTAASAADWKFLHDGTGCTAFVVYKGNDENLGLLLDTGGVKSGAIGMTLYHDDSSTTEGRIALSIRNGGTQIINLAAASNVNAYPAAQWHCACYTYSEADATKVNVFGDGCFHQSGNPSGAPSASNPAAPLRVGLDVDLTAGFALGGSVSAVVLYNRVLSTSERRQVQNYLAVRYGWPVGNVACLGDSITQGTNIARPYPTSLAGRLGAMWRVQNFGANGARIDVGGTDVNDAQWLHSTAGARRRGFNFIVVNVAINDLRNDYSAANCFTDLQTIYNSVLADPDNRLIGCTVTPFKGDSGYTTGREAERITLNSSIRGFLAVNANSYLLDLATILSDPADRQQFWPAYDLDHLHPNQAGADAMAAAVADKVLAVGLG